MVVNKLDIIFINDKENSHHYFLNAIKNVKNYFDNIQITNIQMSDEISSDKKWIIVILENIPLNLIKHDFVENFNKSFTLFIYLAKDYTDKIVTDAYQKEFDYVMNMKLTSPKNFSLFLRNIINKRIEIKSKNQKVILGDLIIDIINHQLWIAGKEIMLTRKELQVLIELTRKPNEYIELKNIFLNVWKTQDDDRTRVTSQYIHRLKNKIGSDRIISENMCCKIIIKDKK